jgi:hypothetical protein
MTRIILLDMDGVLVQPEGYREAVRATVDHFVDQSLTIDEATMAELERRQITSEWDMAPLLVASYWEDILSRQPMPDLPPDAFPAASVIRQNRKLDVPIHITVPEFPLLPGKYPSRSAYEAGCFPHLPEALRHDLLTGTRSVQQSPTTQMIQHFTLGSKRYQETYGLAPRVETESYLLLYDISPISDQIRARLLQPDHHLVAFTNRPSGPPRELGHGLPGYAPEAELALALTGLENIPMIAFGRIEYLASRHGHDAARLEKPSPFHALAAVLAAWTGEELTALQAANHWYETKSLNGKFTRLPEAFDLIVVEDTLGGVRSARAAAEILKQAGFQVNVRPMGLTSGSAAKASTFEQAGVPHYTGWETIIEAIG